VPLSVPPLSVEGEVPKDRNVEPSARCDRVVADVTGLFALPADLPVPAVDGERVRRLSSSPGFSVVTMTDRSVTSGRVRRKTPSSEARETRQRSVPSAVSSATSARHRSGGRAGPRRSRRRLSIVRGRPANLPGRGRQRVEPVARDVCVAIDHGWGVEVGLSGCVPPLRQRVPNSAGLDGDDAPKHPCRVEGRSRCQPRGRPSRIGRRRWCRSSLLGRACRAPAASHQ